MFLHLVQIIDILVKNNPEAVIKGLPIDTDFEYEPEKKSNWIKKKSDKKNTSYGYSGKPTEVKKKRFRNCNKKIPIFTWNSLRIKSNAYVCNQLLFN